MKSTLLNMVVVLFAVTLIASAGVGGIYQLTKEPIAQAELAAVNEALKQVLPDFETTTSQELTLDEMPVVVYTALAAGKPVGYAVQSQTNMGFSGLITMMVGFDTKGTILNVNVLKQAETPGLGTKMTEPENPLLRSVKGKHPAEMNLAVKKDGGDVDALTAATISSRAYVDAVARAYNAFTEISGHGEELDDVSGATDTGEWSEEEGGQNE